MIRCFIAPIRPGKVKLATSTGQVNDSSDLFPVENQVNPA
jgi:hypothetical protein